MGGAGAVRGGGVGRGTAGAGEPDRLTDGARRAAEAAARQSYGRLVASPASRAGSIAAAEDALADAFAAALATWPERGVPDRPDAWLLVAARRNAGHARARATTAAVGEATLLLLADERAEEEVSLDRRLELMFVCAHPAIEPAVQAPLMLQTVLGIDARRIAAAFLVAPATMGQRLVRAKAKVRAARIPFAVPEGAALAERSARVLDAIYAAYGTAWEDVVGADAATRGLAAEAVWLGRLAVELLPDSGEAAGLLALMLHCEARAGSRRDAGGFVPLSRQDPRGWSHAAIVEAEALLRRAAAGREAGRYQTEAAIQSLHAEAAMTGRDLTAPLVALYDLLVGLHPSLGAIVARAASYGRAGRTSEGLAQLEAVAARCRAYQPWWVARAALLRERGQDHAAATAVAIGLTSDPDVRRFLADQAGSPVPPGSSIAATRVERHHSSRTNSTASSPATAV